MSSINSLDRKVNELEKKTNQTEEQHIIIFVDYEGRNEEQKTAHIVHCCEAACSEEQYEQALGEALLSITGKNPFTSEQPIEFITISEKVALKTMQRLKDTGIDISL